MLSNYKIKEQKPDNEQIRKMKRNIYFNCMKFPNVLCVGRECPIYDFYDSCHKQHNRGEF